MKNEVHVGDHLFIDGKPVTVVIQRYNRVWYVPGHVDFFELPSSQFHSRVNYPDGAEFLV